MRIQIASLFMIAGLASGCAQTPLTAHVSPNVQVYASDIGHGKPVGVLVTDERDSQDLGHRVCFAGEGGKDFV